MNCCCPLLNWQIINREYEWWFRNCPFRSTAKGEIVSTLNQYKWSFCNGRDGIFFCNNTRKKHDGANFVTACYQHVRTCKLLSGIRTMWFFGVSSSLGSVCRSKFSELSKSRILLSHWTLSWNKFIPRSPFHNRFLCGSHITLSEKSLQRIITPERSRESAAAVTGKDTGSYTHQKDCNGSLKLFGSSRVMEGKSCLNNLIDFHNAMRQIRREQWMLFILDLERLSTLRPTKPLLDNPMK